MLRTLLAIAAALSTGAAFALLTLFAFRPYASLGELKPSQGELLFSLAFGTLCGALFLWRFFRGASIREEIQRAERSALGDDHLG